MGEGHYEPQKEVQTVKRLLILGVVGIAVVAVGIAAAVAAKRLPGAGLVLVDSKGRALYRSDQERKGMVLCKGACLSF
jgi:predicted lipoprotein with Yx(FWY)xxD motif